MRIKVVDEKDSSLLSNGEDLMFKKDVTSRIVQWIRCKGNVSVSRAPWTR